MRVPFSGASFRTLFSSLLIGLLPTAAQAQVATGYVFSSSAGSFSAITGGTLLWGDALGLTNFDDEVSGAQTIPAFNFNGTVYTQLFVSANGFVTFGSAPSGTNYAPLSSAQGYAGAVSAFGTNVRSRSSILVSKDVRIQTVGSEVVVQWRGVRRFNGGSEFFDAQVRLNTTNGVIRLVYNGPSNLNSATSEQPEVGLRGPNNVFATNVNNRLVGTGAETWAASLAGTANNSTLRFTSASPSKSFSNGLTYTFTPNCSQPAATGTVIPNCTNSTYTVQVTVTNLNGAPSVDLSSSVGGVFANDVGLGTYNTAPLAMGSAQTITVVHNGNSICNLNLGSFNSTCTSPTATTSISTNCAGGIYTVQVNVTGLGSAPSVDLVSTVGGLFADNVGVGSYTSPPVAIGTSQSITMVHNCNTACNVVLGPFNATCTSPTASTSTTVNCAGGTYTVQVNVTGLGSAPSVDLVSTVGGLFADNVGVGSYTSPPVPIGTSSSITMVHNCNAACNVSLGSFNPTSNCVGNGVCLATMLVVPTNGCPSNNLNALVPITFPGTALGVDVMLESVDLIVQNTQLLGFGGNADLEVRLISPGGQSRNMIINRFGTGTNMGNPSNCPGTFLRLIDGGTALTNSNTSNVTGNYAPEQTLAGFTGDPNGLWTLRLCDEGALLSSSLKFIRLNFVSRGSDNPCAPNALACGETRNVNSTAGYPNNLPPGACAFNGGVSTGGVHWWSHTAATTGEVVVSLCGTTSFNSRLSVFLPLPSCSTATCLAMNDNYPGCPNNSSEVRFPATAGQTYLIAVHGNAGGQGNYSIALFCQPACTPPTTNDSCAAALNLPSVIADGTGIPLLQDNTCAYADNPTAVSGGQPVVGLWYSFNSGPNAVHRLRLQTLVQNAAFTATTLSYALYSGTCSGMGAGGEIASVNNAPATNPLPPLTPNTNYRLLVYNRGITSETGTHTVMLEHPGVNDAGITAVSQPTGLICGTFITPQVTLKNFGEATLTSVILEVSIDGAPPILSYPWTGSLAYDSSTVVTLPVVNTPSGMHFVSVSVSQPNGVADEIALNNSFAGTYDASGHAVKVAITTDGNGGQITWTIYDLFFFPVANGGPYPGQNNQTVTTEVCLPSTFGDCFSFYLFDSGGDGLCCGSGNGLWEIRTQDDRVLLRDTFMSTPDGTQSPAVVPGTPVYTGHEICLPGGPSDILASECGLFENNLENKVYCEEVAGASLYQFEFSDPDAGFLRRIAVPRPWVMFGEMDTYPLQPGINYFCRVRVDQGATGFFDDQFGAGCEMGIDPDVVPGCTQLINDPDLPTHSCGVTKSFGFSDKIWAVPVINGTLYKFRFQNLGEGFSRTIQRTNYVCVLNWVTLPLQNGSTYSVQVNVLVNGQWSGYCGAACDVTILNPPQMDDPGQRAFTPVEQPVEATIYPNPVRDGRVNVRLDGLDNASQTIAIEVYAMSGEQLLTRSYTNEGGSFQRSVDLDPSMASGSYLMRITANGHVQTHRLNIVK